MTHREGEAPTEPYKPDGVTPRSRLSGSFTLPVELNPVMETKRSDGDQAELWHLALSGLHTTYQTADDLQKYEETLIPH